MGLRRKARILSFQALYAWELNKVPLEKLIQFSWLDKKHLEEIEKEAIIFSRLLLAGTIENIEEVDRVIKAHLENWDFERVAKVDLAILRLSVYSLLNLKDIPPSVTIDEAIDIAKEFGSDDSYRFVNGMLDGIRKKMVL